jgi:RNA polymerase sigma factor (sigma-70 family)
MMPVAHEPAVLVEQYRDLVCQLAYKSWKMSFLPTDYVEDLRQEAYMALLHAGELFDEDRDVRFITYAYRAIWRRLERAVRRLERQREKDSLREHSTPEYQNHLDKLVMDEDRVRVERVILEMDQETQELLLEVRKGRTQRELAERYGVTHQAIYKRVRAAKAKIKAALE